MSDKTGSSIWKGQASLRQDMRNRDPALRLEKTAPAAPRRQPPIGPQTEPRRRRQARRPSVPAASPGSHGAATGQRAVT